MFRIWGSWLAGSEDPVEQQARYDRANLEREEFLASCMHDLGFTYTPTIVSNEVTIPDNFIPWDSREFAELYGFGISTSPPVIVVGQDTPGGWANQSTWDQMTPTERDAWNYALFGDFFDGGELGGCTREADIALHAAPSAFAALEEEILNLPIASRSDPRIQALIAEWNRCVRNSGYSEWADPFDAPPLWNEWAALNPHDGSGWDFVAFPSGPPRPSAEVVLDFQNRERSVALTDWNCRNSLNFATTQREVELDWQQRFVDQHQNDLQVWAEYAESLRGSGN